MRLIDGRESIDGAAFRDPPAAGWGPPILVELGIVLSWPGCCTPGVTARAARGLREPGVEPPAAPRVGAAHCGAEQQQQDRGVVSIRKVKYVHRVFPCLSLHGPQPRDAAVYEWCVYVSVSVSREPAVRG
jgi:hypothetical protein